MKKKNKKIIQYVVFVRHEKVNNGQLTDNGVKRAIRSGKKLRNVLKKKSIGEPKVAVCSQRWRTIQTLGFILQGFGSKLPLYDSFEEFGDTQSGKFKFPKKFISVVHRNKELKLGTFVANQFILDSYPELSKKRGNEGVAVVKKLFKKERGPFIIVSHGGSRIEPVITSFLGISANKPPFIMDYGSIAILKFAISVDKVELKNVEYLGVLGK
jgi:broad specificity phosphatase PhoE